MSEATGFEPQTGGTYPIAVALNGARRGKADHPALPITPDELAAAARPAAEAGAAMLHLHVRDGDGRHVLDAELYREALGRIRAAVGEEMILQVTTEAVGRYGPGEQMQLVRDLRPEAVSVALRELCPEGGEPEFLGFLDWMRGERIAPQVILYSPAEVARLSAMVRAGDVPFATLPVLYVLGRDLPVTRTQVMPDYIAAADGLLPDFMVCAFGRSEARCGALAALLGGGARVGFENNLQLPDGSVAESNAALVSALTAALGPLDLHPEPAVALRERLERCF